MLDFIKDLVLECDISRERIGAVLMQDGHHIAYSSQGQKGKALLLSTYEMGVLSVLLAMRKSRQYLLVHHQNRTKKLKFMLDQKLWQKSQHPWLVKLDGFHYLVEYNRVQEGHRKSGSRCTIKEGWSEEEIVYKAISIVEPAWLQPVKEMVLSSAFFKDLVQKIKASSTSAQHYHHIKGSWF